MMKLAEALVERQDLKKRLESLTERLQNNAKVQDGTEPAENPIELLKEIDRIETELADIICRINKTNALTQIEGQSLGDWIARRDILVDTVARKRRFLNAASELVERYQRTEIIVKPTVNITQFQRELDDEAKRIREMNFKVQNANWMTDLL